MATILQSVTAYETWMRTQLGSDLIYSLFEDRQAALWIGTSGGLTRLRNGQFKLFTTNEGLPANSIESVYQSRDGCL